MKALFPGEEKTAQPRTSLLRSVGTALVAGPLYALIVLGAFVAGRAFTLLASAGLGARLLPAGTDRIPWRRLDEAPRRARAAAGAPIARQATAS